MTEIKINVLRADEFIALFQSADWEAPGREQVQLAINNSFCVFSLYESGNLIGMSRLLGDGAMSFYVKDFVVLPKSQGGGNGKLLMNAMMDYVKNELPKGYKVSLELISSKDKEGFYEKFGFEKRPCEWDGAGMFMMLET